MSGSRRGRGAGLTRSRVDRGGRTSVDGKNAITQSTSTPPSTVRRGRGRPLGAHVVHGVRWSVSVPVAMERHRVGVNHHRRRRARQRRRREDRTGYLDADRIEAGSHYRPTSCSSGLVGTYPIHASIRWVLRRSDRWYKTGISRSPSLSGKAIGMWRDGCRVENSTLGTPRQSSIRYRTVGPPGQYTPISILAGALVPTGS